VEPAWSGFAGAKYRRELRLLKMEVAGGRSVENDGWAKLVLGSEFAHHAAANRASLRHELCHYILCANGIRIADRADNEQLMKRPRSTGELRSAREDELRRRLRKRLIRNDTMVQPHLTHVRRRVLTMSDPERLEALLNDFDVVDRSALPVTRLTTWVRPSPEPGAVSVRDPHGRSDHEWWLPRRAEVGDRARQCHLAAPRSEKSVGKMATYGGTFRGSTAI
jgi:hypothetical protein